MEHKKMYMTDYVEQLDRILSGAGKKVLDDAGKISHRQAIEKAESEYKKYIQKNLSPVEKSYLDTISEAAKIAKQNCKK